MKKLIFASLLVSSSAYAQMFTPSEVTQHRERIQIITSTASNCLKSTYSEHVDFFKRHGVSKFYGDRRPDYRTREGRAQALEQYGASPELINELVGTSCIGLTVKCLGLGFKAAGQADTWKKIYDQLKVDDKMYGTDLQIMLRQLGWKTLYWNPDVSQNAKWDEEDRMMNPLKPGKQWNPVWGGHAERYRSVMTKGSYYGIPVDDASLLVNFGDVQPAEFTKAPFFVGTAHAGYHVFPGFQGRIIEAHSMRNLNSFDNLEISEFNPFAPGGGPRWTRVEKYRSGVIAVPPR